MASILLDTGLGVIAVIGIFGYGVFRFTGRGNTLVQEPKAEDWDWPLASDLQARRGISWQARVYARKS